MADKIQCSERVTPKEPWGSFHRHLCHRPAKVQRDGLWYCAVHDPKKVEAREAVTSKLAHEKYIANLPNLYGKLLLAMIEKILPILEEGIKYNYSESEPHQQLLKEAKELVARAKGAK